MRKRIIAGDNGGIDYFYIVGDGGNNDAYGQEEDDELVGGKDSGDFWEEGPLV
ncbi:MAG TPA: hypothetical protein VF595_02355 [Tepidisphaeraceae bacterium]|jgi:hypothetical protein